MNDETVAALERMAAADDPTPAELVPAGAQTALDRLDPGAPTPLFSGTVAVYEDGQGGYVMVAQDSDGTTHRKHIPALLVKAALGGGPLGSLFKRVRPA